MDYKRKGTTENRRTGNVLEKIAGRILDPALHKVFMSKIHCWLSFNLGSFDWLCRADVMAADGDDIHLYARPTKQVKKSLDERDMGVVRHAGADQHQNPGSNTTLLIPSDL